MKYDESSFPFYGIRNLDNLGARTSAVLAGAHVGARYFFTDSFATNAELGYGIAILKIGVSFKF